MRAGQTKHTGLAHSLNIKHMEMKDSHWLFKSGDVEMIA